MYDYGFSSDFFSCDASVYSLEELIMFRSKGLRRVPKETFCMIMKINVRK